MYSEFEKNKLIKFWKMVFLYAAFLSFSSHYYFYLFSISSGSSYIHWYRFFYYCISTLLPDAMKSNVVCSSINYIWVLYQPTRHQSIALVHPKGSVIPFPPLMSDVNLKNGNSIYSSSNHMGRRRRELNSIIAWHGD